ncbi:hypothetical protein BLGI_793 [Brevibacillus laterosporus GI-9]|nr:hypothetical protein BLGI_793 [Brevibacillus laterosporus GI-9]
MTFILPKTSKTLHHSAIPSIFLTKNRKQLPAISIIGLFSSFVIGDFIFF